MLELYWIDVLFFIKELFDTYANNGIRRVTLPLSKFLSDERFKDFSLEIYDGTNLTLSKKNEGDYFYLNFYDFESIFGPRVLVQSTRHLIGNDQTLLEESKSFLALKTIDPKDSEFFYLFKTHAAINREILCKLLTKWKRKKAA